MSEREFCDAVFAWFSELRRSFPGPDPFKFALASRRWSKAAKRFGRPLREILEADGRFHLIMDRQGALLMSLASAEVDETTKLFLAVERALKEDGREVNTETMREYWPQIHGEPAPF